MCMSTESKYSKGPMVYYKAVVKFNGGNGALLCNHCHVIIKDGFDHEDREHLCQECALDELVRLGQEWGLYDDTPPT